jgi:hypothetical protein
MLPKVSLLIAGFQHSSVLDDDADFAVKSNLGEQVLHRGGEHLGCADLAAELDETNPFRVGWTV